MRLLDPGSNFVYRRLLEVELVFLDDVADLLLETLGLLGSDVLNKVETGLAENGYPLLRYTNFGPLGRCALRNLLLGLHLREQHDLANGELTGEQHHQTVDTDTDTKRRRHTILQGTEEVLIDDHGLVVALVGQLHLLNETLLLIDGVVELGVGVGQLLTIHHQLEALGEAGLRAMHLGEG